MSREQAYCSVTRGIIWNKKISPLVLLTLHVGSALFHIISRNSIGRFGNTVKTAGGVKLSGDVIAAELSCGFEFEKVSEDVDAVVGSVVPEFLESSEESDRATRFGTLEDVEESMDFVG